MNCEKLSDDLQVAWSIDGDNIMFELAGKIGKRLPYMYILCLLITIYAVNMFSLFAVHMFNLCSAHFQFMQRICLIYAAHMFNLFAVHKFNLLAVHMFSLFAAHMFNLCSSQVQFMQCACSIYLHLTASFFRNSFL